MPGIVGFIGKNILPDTHPCLLEVAGKVSSSWCIEGQYQQLIKTTADIAHHHFNNQNLSVDIWGDVYSINAIDCQQGDVAELIANQYLIGNLSELCSQLNGYFAFVIFDKQTQKITLVTDRFGIKPLYMWDDNNLVKGFASEPKALVLNPDYKQQIDLNALKTFVDVGHMLGTQTLFSNIKRLAPASITTINMTTLQYDTAQYWSWADIKTNNTITFDEAIDDAYTLFDNAVSRCLKTIKQPTLAITLSGGLDSRVLLAAAKEHFKGTIKTYTFGEAGCDDAVLAKQVAQLAGVSNQLVSIDEHNWFEGREQGVWLTDGLKNILHMHALSSVSNISADSNYLLNGYLGDVTFGGSYLFAEDKSSLSQQQRLALRYFEHTPYANITDDYFKHANDDPVLIYNRGVRFIGAGSDLLSHELHNLKPFMDNDLVEFLYSLPDEYRRNGKLYHAMLLRYYPDYFKTIAWQQTGKPISLQSTSVEPARSPVKQRLKGLIKGSAFEALARKLYRNVTPKRHYVAYDTWLREPQFKHFVKKTLCKDNSEVKKLLGSEFVDETVNSFFTMSDTVKPEKIGSLLTVELYLKRLQ
ncbi:MULTISPECIES: asparagine synthase-related protein [unclassified Pseudoalteromonas]|uniref:asparagine synthase-related protein n=1 Tax=unclassified Pseudoalteromonas TaxID=194690 RepID=UPI001408AC5C|nr:MULTISPECIES: asparagine synthase-related protein [unclassified Pseudoalteromonas]MBH0025400.1 asparagine synthetase B family protein [Pseudoalteromonas sp. SWN29]